MLNKAKELFYKGDYSGALEIFKRGNLNYEAGLCTLLCSDVELAKSFWTKDKDRDVATRWGLIVINLIYLKVKERPTFFQLRAFLEVYLNLFIESGNLGWAENLISACDIFARYNPESYKFIARALFANGYLSLAHTFLNESKKLFYSDPEAHFIDSQAFFLEKEYDKALFSINETLKCASDYYPALEFKKLIEQKIKTPGRVQRGGNKA